MFRTCNRQVKFFEKAANAAKARQVQEVLVFISVLQKKVEK
jgi:hypothetical protein